MRRIVLVTTELGEGKLKWTWCGHVHGKIEAAAKCERRLKRADRRTMLVVEEEDWR